MARKPPESKDIKTKPMLPPEDRRQWEACTADVEPLLPPLRVKLAEDRSPAPPSVKPKAGKQVSVAPVGMPAPVRKPAGFELDRGTEARLRKGRMAIEARLDLHGMTQSQAHAGLLEFLLAADAAGKRCVLVITGKGLRRESGEGGILRQRLPDWIALNPLRDIVLKTTPAAPKDGGSGAFYIYLRRRRGSTE